MNQLGVRAAGSRIEEYRRIISRESGRCTEDTIRAGEYDKLVWSLQESSDLIDLLDLDKSILQQPDILEKLHALKKGHAFLVDRKLANNDRGRDNAVEFTVAAHLTRQGKFHGFSKLGGDLLMADFSCIRPIECKRLSSIGALRTSLRLARNRLRRDYRSYPAGLSVIDITLPCFPPGQRLFGKDEEDLRRNAAKKVNEFMLREGEPFFAKEGFHRADFQLGIVVRAVAVGVAGSESHLRQMPIWSYVETKPKGAPDWFLFRELLEGFSPGDVVDSEEIYPFPRSLAYAIATKLPGRLRDKYVFLEERSYLDSGLPLPDVFDRIWSDD